MSDKISEREQFEEFMHNKFGDSVDLTVCKNGDGGYMAWDANVAEAAFNAGHRAADAQAVRPVKLPQRQTIAAYEYGSGDGFMIPRNDGEALKYDEVIAAIKAAGGTIEGLNEICERELLAPDCE